MKINYKLQQGSEEWHELKYTKIGGTRAKSVMVKKGIEEAVKNKQYANNSAEYRKYLEKYEQDSDTNLKQSTSKRLYSIDQLVRDNFLVISNKYRNLF
jgi:hypothetical protein